jgi:hypothetical protein
VFKTLIVPRSSIVPDAFVHKPMGRRTQGDQGSAQNRHRSDCEILGDEPAGFAMLPHD